MPVHFLPQSRIDQQESTRSGIESLLKSNERWRTNVDTDITTEKGKPVQSPKPSGTKFQTFSYPVSPETQDPVAREVREFALSNSGIMCYLALYNQQLPKALIPFVSCANTTVLASGSIAGFECDDLTAIAGFNISEVTLTIDETIGKVLAEWPATTYEFESILSANNPLKQIGKWETIFSTLENLSSLKDGWNGYSAPAPETDSIATARSFLDTLKESKLTPTRIAASAIGGVGITCRNHERKVYIEFFNDGQISALFADDMTQTMSTQRIEADLSNFESLISNMEDYLND